MIREVQKLASVKDATVIVFGDNHLWPGEELNVADRALHKIIKSIKPRPRVIVQNGDLFDFPHISRHPRTSGYFPDVADELEAGRAYLAHIEKIAPQECSLIHCVGNHDDRAVSSIANRAPEFLRILGDHLNAVLPNWTHCWQLLINKRVVVMHYWHTGLSSAGLNNVLKSGADGFITNHLHGGQITSTTDFDGHIRWAVDTGCMAEFDITQRKFSHYTRGTPTRWKQGFAVLTFDETGRLLPPELVQVVRGKAYFRGQAL